MPIVVKTLLHIHIRNILSKELFILLQENLHLGWSNYGGPVGFTFSYHSIRFHVINVTYSSRSYYYIGLNARTRTDVLYNQSLQSTGCPNIYTDLQIQVLGFKMIETYN